MANNSIIEQSPLHSQLPVGQDIIFVISNDLAVFNEVRVKFVAHVSVSGDSIPNANTTSDVIGTFKTTPNSAGVGIFNFRNILENYTKPDNLAANGSSYKGTTTSDDRNHPIHLIDKYSLNNNSVRFFAIKFAVEYLGATDVSGNQDNNVVREQAGTEVLTPAIFTMFNGFLKFEDELEYGTGTSADNFGYDMSNFELGSNTKNLLTNAPTTLYANLEDYGTFAFLAWNTTIAAAIDEFLITYYKTDGSTTTETIEKSTANGAYPVTQGGWNYVCDKQLLYIGLYPANLQNHSTTFAALITAGTIQGGYYTIVGRNAANAETTKTYTINLNCSNLKGYESIRLCWLNQWGAWDYYTFTQKSTNTLSTTQSTYTQLEGTWNARTYKIDNHLGGKKTFRTNATERITMNTNYLTKTSFFKSL